jgi:hypothetical protein
MSLKLRPLKPLGKNPQYPLDSRLNKSQTQPGSCVKEKNLLAQQGIEP